MGPQFFEVIPIRNARYIRGETAYVRVRYKACHKHSPQENRLTCDKPELLETILAIPLNVASLLQFITSFQELEQEGSKKNIPNH